MSDYNQYITSINKIFDYLSKMKAGWKGQDNINYIESIEEYKQIVVHYLESFKDSTKPVEEVNNTENVEVPSND